jgi:catechol 2,3-dioxygenase-like lactoylglutathione lyase family enzyme
VLGTAPCVACIPVRDQSAARRFYEGILGLQVREESSFALVVDAYGTTVRITPVGEFVPQPFTVASWEVPNIVATARELTAAGIAITRLGMEQDELGIQASPNGDSVAWFKGPDGNTLSLTTFATK